MALRAQPRRSWLQAARHQITGAAGLRGGLGKGGGESDGEDGHTQHTLSQTCTLVVYSSCEPRPKKMREMLLWVSSSPSDRWRIIGVRPSGKWY